MLGEAGGGGGKQAHLTLQGTEIEEGREDENSWPGISWERCKEAGDVNRHRARLLAPGVSAFTLPRIVPPLSQGHFLC